MGEGKGREGKSMQQETLSVVHHRTLVLAGLGVVDYVTLLPPFPGAALDGRGCRDPA